MGDSLLIKRKQRAMTEVDRILQNVPLFLVAPSQDLQAISNFVDPHFELEELNFVRVEEVFNSIR